MKYVVTVIWTIIFGFVVGFIGSKLTQTQFNPQMTLLVSAAFGIILDFLPAVLAKSSQA